MIVPPEILLGIGGLAIGSATGFAVRRARLCTFGAIEDAFMGADTRRLKVFGLALAIALAGTQLLIIWGFLDGRDTNYVFASVPWLSILLGSLLFGLGMALVGTCSFGSLIRLGSGDMRSLVVLIVLGASAYAALRGSLSPLRVSYLETFIINPAAAEPSDIPTILHAWTGASLRSPMAAALVLGLAVPALFDHRLRRSPRLLTGAIVLGLGIVVAWGLTNWLADDFIAPRHPQGLNFVSTVGKFLFGSFLISSSLPDFAGFTILGVILGAFISASISDEFRWEAFDDHHEMKRHLLGAALMGVGGVLAGGCTIGQGLTAGSLLAISSPLAIVGMFAGARIGIYFIMGGSLREMFAKPDGKISKNSLA